MRTNMGHRQWKDKAEPGIKIPSLLVALTLVMLSLAAVLLIPVDVYAGQQTIKNVKITDTKDCVQIAVTTSEPLSIHPSRVGKYIAFDLYGTLAYGQDKSLKIDSGGINTVKCGWFKSTPPVTRIAVGTSVTRKYTVDAQNNKRLTTILISKNGNTPQMAVNTAPKIDKAALVKSTITAPVSTISSPLVDILPVELNTVSPIRTLDLQAVNIEPAASLRAPNMLVASAEPMVIGDATAAAIAMNGIAASKTVSLDFVSTEIHDVLKALAVQSGVNIVASPDVKGNITVSLNKVTVEEALRLVTNISGYKFAESNGAFVVGTEANIDALGSLGVVDSAQTNTDVVMIKYSDPTILEKLVQKQYPSVRTTMALSSKDSGLKSVGTVVLSGSAADVQGAKNLISQIESGMSESFDTEVTEIYEIKYADANEISGALTAAIPSIKISMGPSAGFMLKAPKALALDASQSGGNNAGEEIKALPKYIILQGGKSDVERAKNIATGLDIQQSQIIIEAKVVDISDDAAKDLGIEWGGEFGVLSAIGLSENRSDGMAVDKIARFSRSPLSFSGDIKAIVSSGKGKVLANPNVMAIDGKPASVFIGDEVKYVTRIEKDKEKTTVTTETARVGVQLHTVSSINSDGYITMNLHPEVSVITGWKQISEVSLALPEISRRYVDSTVRIKDGETIVIGGLIKDDEIVTMSGIPLLKNLPLIGQLFRYDHKTKVHSEVMMFITPRIVKNS